MLLLSLLPLQALCDPPAGPARAARAPQAPAKDAPFYAKAGVSGALAAGTTHFLTVPLDVVKTRMQLAPTLYPSTGAALRTIFAEEGIRGLTAGLAPTNYGYFIQGFFKYSLYELFKTKYARIAGQHTAERHATLLYLAAGTTAEAIADVFLTPFEAVRIRLVADRTYASSTARALRKIVATEGLGALYRGFVPLLLKQVPYTAVKFAVFEAVEECIYERVLRRARHQLPSATQLAVTAASGLVGGVFAAVASHPADTILTRANTTNAPLLSIVHKAGVRGIWAGLLPRIAMVGFLASLQLLVYDTAKVVLFGLPTSQGIKRHPSHHPPGN